MPKNSDENGRRNGGIRWFRTAIPSIVVGGIIAFGSWQCNHFSEALADNAQKTNRNSERIEGIDKKVDGVNEKLDTVIKLLTPKGK